MGRMNQVRGRASCEVCGKNRERCFEVHLGGEKHVFDSFECAMRGLIPRCGLCGCVILGPGVHTDDGLHCSSMCASLSGVREYEVRVLMRGRPKP